MTEGFMKIKQRINAASLLAAASLTFSPAAWSLGLGDVTVESFLNQPLQVKIDLISRETDDMASVTARLASADDYEMIGASRESVAVPIHFSVEDIDGDAYILATSSLPISDPVLRLIVEVNWSSGRQLREYTVFLDPATFSERAPIPRIDKRAVPAPAVATAPDQPAEKTPEASPGEPAAEVTAGSKPAREPVDGEYGPVANGETLWGIASNWSRGTGLDINRVMIAIQRENPQAFLRDNINLLKRGAILRMPRVDDVRAISAAAAISEVREQQDALNSRGSTASAASPATPLLAAQTAISDVEEGRQEIDETIPEEEISELEPVVEELTEQEPDLSPQLELVPPSQESSLDSAYGFEESEDSSADASIAVSALREDLARTEEDLITQQQQNEYLAERIKELESQLASTEQGNVEDANMANMEERLREQRLAEAAATEKESTPWYSRISVWLIGLLVFAAGFTGWWFSRRRSADDLLAGSDDQQLREIKDEAEEVLRVLNEPDGPDAAVDAADETADEKEGAASDSAAPQKGQRSARPLGTGDGNAEVLDEESSDPEIQLDLARAYISMGDKEAARVILEEVGTNGSEEQREEANKMLKLLIP
jgi:pilus assembly protein FimV